MKKDAPEDTGRLKNNIEFEVKHKLFHDEILFTSEAIDPDDGFDYAPVQEFGGRFNPAKPYFWKNIRRFFGELDDSIDEKVNKIFKQRT